MSALDELGSRGLIDCSLRGLFGHGAAARAGLGHDTSELVEAVAAARRGKSSS
jgi:hypothetical protein